MMRLAALFALLVLSACAGTGRGERFSAPHATGYVASEPQQCVPFARAESGIKIFGDAATWWDKAPPEYAKGIKPKRGAVMVLAASGKMPHGHLAVVKRIVDDRQIDVTHSNWGSNRATRSIIYESHRVEDVSRANDWSSVRFWNKDANAFGFPYAVRGFLYK